MSATKKKKLSWKEKIVRDMERAEKLLPEPEFMQGDWPEWARQMAVELFKTVAPGVRDLEDPTAHELGRLVGLKQAGMRELEEWEPSEKELEALERLLKKEWGEKAEEKFTEYLRLCAESFYPAYQRAISRALTLASKQDGREQEAFFSGYSRMVGQRPDVRTTTTTKIYFVMVLNWKLFDWLAKSGRFSVRQLHDLLCQVFGAHLVGDLKNTEKMCERKGLSFRQRGRPSLPEKSDTQAA